MLRRLMPTLLILICFLLDTTVLPVVYGGVYTVPLTVVAVFLIGMLMGRMSGLLYGTIGGLLIDITSGTLGLMTFFFMAMGFLVGLILYDPRERPKTGRRQMRRKFARQFGWVFVLYALGEATLFVIQYFSTALIRPIYLINIAVRCLICATLTVLLKPLAQALLVGNRRRLPARNREVRSF